MKIAKQVIRLIREDSSVIDGLKVTGPLVALYKNPDELAKEFSLRPYDVKEVISDIFGFSKHSSGVELQLKKLKKYAQVSVSKLDGDAKYLKRNKDNATKEEKQYSLLKHLKSVLSKEDGESFEE